MSVETRGEEIQGCHFTGCRTRSESSKAYLLQVMPKQFLFLLVLLVAISPNGIFVGGYTDITNQPDQYSKALSFVVTQYPELARWTVASVKRQVVNGFNYELTLRFKGEAAVVKLSSSFSGSLSLTSYTLNSQSQPLSPPKDTTPVAKKEALVPIEPIVNVISNNETNTSSNATVNDVYLVQNPTVFDTFLVGGFQVMSLSNPEAYNAAWTEIVSAYPNLHNFTIIEVRSQVVAGINFVFALESPFLDEIIVIRVYQSLSHIFTINIVQTNTAVGFSSQEIIAFQKKCLQLKPELTDYQLVYISNSQGSSGLKLLYSLNDLYITADCSYLGKDLNVVFQ